MMCVCFSGTLKKNRILSSGVEGGGDLPSIKQKFVFPLRKKFRVFGGCATPNLQYFLKIRIFLLETFVNQKILEFLVVYPILKRPH